MKKLFYLFIAIITVIGSCKSRNEITMEEENSGKRIEILFLGHNSQHHNSEKYAPMLAIPLFQKGINLTYTADLKDLTPENLHNYDGVMIYANHNEIEEDQEQALKDFVEGGKALIPIHSASYCFRNSDWYVNTVGGQFKSHRADTFVANIVKPEHAVMQGLQEFETWDETYVHTRINPDMEILMERVEGDHREPWTWVRKQGEGNVFYTAYGHDERTWSQPGFHELIANGVLWAVNDEAKKRLSQLDIPQPIFEDADIPNYERKDPAPKFQHALSPEESQKLIQVPVGFRLELFASEPDIINPIAMAWDEKGRLWVIETVDYPNEVRNEEGIGNDRIKIIEDTDDDGKADKFTVFADNLNIPTSITFANGGVVVSMAPHLLYLKDTNGDDKADVREIINTGWGKGDTHAGPSNLKYGLDNKIWGVLGYSGYKGEVNGEAVSFGQGVYRLDPDGQNLQYLGRTSNNTWGLGFSEEFDVFISTANGLHSAYLAMPNQFIKRAIKGGSSNTVHRIETHYDMPHVTPHLRQVDWHGGYTAAGGHNMYTARSYPKSFWNSVGLVNEPTGRVLHKALIEKKGAGYTERNGFNLLASSDEWFAPVHSEVGPDGAIWVADWYNFIIQHNPTPRGFENGEGNAYVNPWRDSQHGRIYRLVYKKAKPYEAVELDREDVESLVAGLKSDNMFWRTTAQRLIVETQNKEAIDDLIEIINDQQVDEIGLNSPAVHALWTLHGLGELHGANAKALEAVAKALSHPAAGVRQNAVRVLPKNQNSLKRIMEADLVNDPDLKTRLAAVIKFAELPSSPEAGKLLYEASMKKENNEDEYLPQAFFAAVLAHKDGFMSAAPESAPAEIPDSLMNLTERIIRSMTEEQYTLDRWSPIMYPPDVTRKEIAIKVTMAPTDKGLEGVIASQGNSENGYSFYVQDKKLHWLIKQDGKAYKVTSNTTVPSEKFDAVGRLGQDGVMSIDVNGKTVAKKVGVSLFTKPLTSQKVRVGYDLEGDERVGSYGDRFRIEGHLNRDGVLELKEKTKKCEATEAETVAAITQEKNERAIAETPGAKSAAKSKASAGTVIDLKVIEHEMKFDKGSFTVKAGQQVTIRFSNPDFMQHNVVIGKPGTFETIGAAADALARDPKGAEQEYVPNIPQVIAATKLVNPEQSETLVFTAPSTPGDYPYVCTVPGHWRLMNGVMKVVK